MIYLRHPTSGARERTLLRSVLFLVVCMVFFVSGCSGSEPIPRPPIFEAGKCLEIWESNVVAESEYLVAHQNEREARFTRIEAFRNWRETPSDVTLRIYERAENGHLDAKTSMQNASTVWLQTAIALQLGCNGRGDTSGSLYVERSIEFAKTEIERMEPVCDALGEGYQCLYEGFHYS